MHIKRNHFGGRYWIFLQFACHIGLNRLFVHDRATIDVRCARVLLCGILSNLYIVYKFKAFYTSLSRLHSTFTWQIVPVSLHSICGPYGVSCMCAPLIELRWCSNFSSFHIFCFGCRCCCYSHVFPSRYILFCDDNNSNNNAIAVAAAVIAITVTLYRCCVLMNLTSLIPPAHNLFIAFSFIFFHM